MLVLIVSSPINQFSKKDDNHRVIRHFTNNTAITHNPIVRLIPIKTKMYMKLVTLLLARYYDTIVTIVIFNKAIIQNYPKPQIYFYYTENTDNNFLKYFKLFALEFSFTFACLVFGRQALTLLNR
ncbi:MAG: hypothetical protein LBP59_18420 [Planctomycetaceae bacterium]|nr:hypothetical protein [Planctomycetaceae bacterium]